MFSPTIQCKRLSLNLHLTGPAATKFPARQSSLCCLSSPETFLESVSTPAYTIPRGQTCFQEATLNSGGRKDQAPDKATDTL